MKKLLSFALLLVIFTACKKAANSSSKLEVTITGSATQNFTVLIRTEDGSSTFINEKNNSGTKTFKFDTKFNEKLSVNISSGSNFPWKLKAYRDGTLVKDETSISSGSYSTFF